MTLRERVCLYFRHPSAILVTWKAIWFRHWTLRRTLSVIRPGDTVIDCGANVGDYTEQFVSRGAKVYAFEPHPRAFERLQSRFAGNPHVTCMNQAVAAREGRVALCLHANDSDNPVLFSQGASIIRSKPNVDTANSIEVQAVSLAEFVRRLNSDVAVLK